MKRGVQFGRTTAWHSAVGLAAGEQNKRKKGDAIDGEAGGGDWSAVKDYFPGVWDQLHRDPRMNPHAFRGSDDEG